METIEDIKAFMIRWNNSFPYDFWWRKKHNIAFMSPAHRECSFISQLMEFQEDQLFKEYEKNQDKDVPEYIPNMGQWLKNDYNSDSIASREITQDDVDLFLEEAKAIEEKEAALKKEKDV
jgi:hypothetical protein